MVEEYCTPGAFNYTYRLALSPGSPIYMYLCNIEKLGIGPGNRICLITYYFAGCKQSNSWS